MSIAWFTLLRRSAFARAAGGFDAPTAETLLLNRFDALASGPDRLTENDRDAVVVGWRRSWRTAETETVRRMAPRMDGNMVARDRSLAMLWVAATAPGWDTVQHSIWR